MPKNTVEISLVLKDRIARAYKRVSGTVRGQNKQIQTSIKQTQAAANGLSGALRKVAGAATAFFAFRAANNIIRDSIKLAGIQADAETRVSQTIKATGQAAGVTADELKEMASGLQKVTTFGDETILRGQSMLLTFKNIGKDVFPKATEAMLNLSTAMGTDVKESAIQLGKALNDPKTGLTALRRVGITFTDAQEEMIKGFQDSGEMAKAQTLILQELESQFGGLARAVAETDEGRLKQFHNTLGDIQERLGKAILPVILDVTKKIQNFIIEAEKSGKIQQAIDGVANSFKWLVDNINTLIKIGKVFFTVWAVGKIQALVTGFARLATGLISMNPVMAGLTAAAGALVLILDKMDENAENNAKSMEAFTKSLPQTQDLKALVTQMNETKDALAIDEATLESLYAGQSKWSAAINGTSEEIQNQSTTVQAAREKLEGLKAKFQDLTNATNLKMWESGTDMIKVLEHRINKLSAAATTAKTALDTGTGGAGAGAVTATTGGKEQPEADAHVQAHQRAIEAGQKLQDALSIQRMEGKNRELAELELEYQQKAEILLAGNQSLENLDKVSREKRAQIYWKYKNQELADEKANADKTKLIEQAKLNSAISTAQSIAGSLEYLAGKRKEYANLYKAVAIGETIVSTYQGAQNAFTSMSSIPIVGPALGAAAAAAAVVAGLVRVHQITAQKFATGGVVQGSRDTVPAMLTPGEMVLNSQQQRNLMNMANGNASGAVTNDITINIENGDAATVRAGVNAALADTYQERLQAFADMDTDAQALEVM